jgi:hypothetical protein
MESATGATEIDKRTAGMTVSREVPAMCDEESVAVIVVAPVARPVARPLEEIDDVVVMDEDHVTLAVKFLLPRSE